MTGSLLREPAFALVDCVDARFQSVAGKRVPPGPTADFAAERERMVSEQLVRRGIHDPRVLGR